MTFFSPPWQPAPWVERSIRVLDDDPDIVPVERLRYDAAMAKRDGARAPETTVLYALKSPAFPAGRMLIASPLTLLATRVGMC